jgi:GT2 family glycosyltransferase
VTLGVSVVVVTWNGLDLTLRCLESLRPQRTEGMDVELVVVDNGSTDGTAAALREEYRQAELLALHRNHGFAVANNRALPLARAPLVLLLNNDATVCPGAVEALLAAAEAHPECAVFVPEMLRMAEPDVVDNRGIWLDASARCRQLDAGLPALPPRAEGEVFGASGGACLLRRSVIDALGLFDESLGSYWEDCDFALRVRAAGHRAWYVPAAQVLHEGSATANRIPDRKLYLIHRNMTRVCARWMPFRPWRLSSWLGAAVQLYYLVQAARDGRLATLLRAWLDAGRAGVGPLPRGVDRARLRPWIGRRTAPVRVA